MLHKGHINGDEHRKRIQTGRTNIMTRKTLIALTAAVALSIGFAASAKAETNLNIDFGINLGHGYYDSGYGGGYYDAGYDDEDCGFRMVKHKRWNWNHTRKIVTWSKKWVCY
jgi:hypothetical protein